MEVPKILTGKLNVDDVIEALPDGDYTFMLNGVIGTSYNGKRGSIENMLGASLIDTAVTQFSEDHQCIGGCPDVANNRHFVFMCHKTGTNHGIVEVKLNDDGSVGARTLYSGASLNFDTDFPVQATYVNKYIYYTDNYDPIKAAKVWETGEDPEWANLIRRGGIYAPTFVKSTDTSVSLNLIYNKEFQFAYQYVYDNNELSVLSPYSLLCPKNIESTQTFNKITVSIPTAEVIPDNVKKIKFAVRIGNNGTFQYIGTLDRVETNNFTTKSIAFFNSVYGGVVELDYETNYHDVPLTARTIEFIKSRLWLGNLTEGYNQPESPNMTVAVSTIADVAGGEAIYTNNVQFYSGVKQYNYTRTFSGTGYVTITFQSESTESQNLASTSTSSASVYGSKVSLVTSGGITAYEYDSPSAFSRTGNLPVNAQGGALYPYGASSSITVADFSGGTLSANLTLYRLNGPFNGVLRTFTPAGNGSAYDGSKTFPNNSTYRVGVIYKDIDGRSSSVVVAPQQINTNSNTYSSKITASWELPSGILDPNPIPEWAYSYHVVISKNITKSYFVELRASRLNYYKDNTLYPDYSVDRTGIKVDITPYINSGLSYSFSEGDRVVIYKPDGSSTYNLQIKSFEGGQLILANTDIQTITNQNPIIEIYRPKIVSDDVIYYEIGQGYEILNPGTQNRSFSTTSGTILGDSYNLLRDTYFYNGTAYAKSASKTLFKQMSYDIKTLDWNTDGGKLHLVSDKGQIKRPNTVKYSSPFIIGTEVNGLSEFYSSEQSEIPYENGEIMKLKSANKTASDGTVLLAIGRNRVASMYIGESRLNINADTSYLIQGSQIVGEINTLNGWYGTNHPSSVFDDGKNVYWFSQPKRAYVRYNQSGIFPISEYKVTDFFGDVSSRTITDDFTNVCGGYCPFYDIIFVTVDHSNTFSTEVSANNEIQKTISYNDANQSWMSFHSFVPQYYFDIDDKMFTIEGGDLYRHDNDSSFGSYIGNSYPTRVYIPLNNNAMNPKIWRSLQLYGSPKWITWGGSSGGQIISNNFNADIEAKLRANGDGYYSMVSTIYSTEFEVYESVIYGSFMFDENTGSTYNDQVADLISTTATLDLSFKCDEHRYFTMVKVGFIPSNGHTL